MCIFYLSLYLSLSLSPSLSLALALFRSHSRSLCHYFPPQCIISVSLSLSLPLSISLSLSLYPISLSLSLSLSLFSLRCSSCGRLFAVVGDCKADVIFVIDSFRSIGDTNWLYAKQFLMDVVQGLNVRQLRFLRKMNTSVQYFV